MPRDLSLFKRMQALERENRQMRSKLQQREIDSIRWRSTLERIVDSDGDTTKLKAIAYRALHPKP